MKIPNVKSEAVNRRRIYIVSYSVNKLLKFCFCLFVCLFIIMTAVYRVLSFLPILKITCGFLLKVLQMEHDPFLESEIN